MLADSQTAHTAEPDSLCSQPLSSWNGQTGPAQDVLDLIARAGLTVRAALREKGTPYADLGLGDPSVAEEQLLDAMLEHPILINRPLVVTPRGVRLCRPSEVVLDILPAAQKGAFAKEDGEPVIDSEGRRVHQ